MRLLCMQARRFAWQSHRQTVDQIDGEPLPEVDVRDELDECVVVFAHAERDDEPEQARARAFKHTLKHVKWLANKRDLRNVVLHSFTHLGADSSSPGFARDFLVELAGRLAATGYTVKCTPFGYLCAWQIDVLGDSLAKVYKQI